MIRRYFLRGSNEPWSFALHVQLGEQPHFGITFGSLRHVRGYYGVFSMSVGTM